MARRPRELLRRIEADDGYSEMPFTTCGDTDWQRQNIAEINAWLGGKAGHWASTAPLVARAHPFAVQWLQQAPCLLPIISEVSYSNRERAIYAKWLFETFRRPRDMLAAAGVAPQFMALHIALLYSVRAGLLRQISAVHKPSDIAQIIPRQAATQQDWLRFCQMFREPIERRVACGKRRKAELVAWAAAPSERLAPPRLHRRSTPTA